MKTLITCCILAGVLLGGCKRDRTPPPPAGNTARPDTTQATAAPVPVADQFEAARTGNLAKVKAYLAAGGDINATDPYHTTMLHFAADAGKKDVAAFLIEKGLSVNTVNDDGFTPLHSCALHGDSATAALLIAKGATVYVRDNNQMTPLHLCGLNDNLAVAKVLVAHGADINDMTTTQWTPLRVAQYGKAKQMQAWLTAQGAKQ